jgi:hypothetical protein
MKVLNLPDANENLRDFGSFVLAATINPEALPQLSTAEEGGLRALYQQEANRAKLAHQRAFHHAE